MSDQYTDRYNNLNPQQQKAVDTLEGPVLVVAGPGSGKTELLSLRVANILRTQDVSPSNILCLTYTEAAATNMRQRLAGLVGPAAYQVAIHTFHSFATEIINRFPEYFYNGASFQPADELTQIELLENIFNGLSYSNPLSSKHQQAYTYLGDVQSAIADLKKAGITPNQFEQIIQQNSQILEKISPAIEAVFTPRVSKQTIEQIQELIGQLSVLYQEESGDESGLGRPESLAKSLGTSLNLALASALELDKTSPISEWKRKYTTKDSQDRIMLKDVQRLPKMRALADVYRQYRHDLHAAGYFDFDDMLLDVLEALSSQAELRYALQEQYQYVLVDEFQDTNDAQMRLINYVTDAPVYEGRPNIMAVGDDDQAIYKFQGAKIANIQQFREHYQDVTQIVLVKNYRSGQAILDLARHVIVQGEDRLENYYSDIIKELEAAGQQAAGEISMQQFATREHELMAVAEHIKQEIADGQEVDTIAVIARRRRDLEDISRHLERIGVPVRYDRQRNVLQEPHIRQLITMARFVVMLSRHQQAEADELLPEILSYPFWNIDRQALWQISVQASQAKSAQERLWLHQMETAEHAELPIIATWFKELRKLAETQTLESMLEKLIGAHTPLLPADADADDDTWMQDTPRVAGYTSPFKEHYFDGLQRQSQRSQYISFLSSLQVFIQSLRAYKSGQPLKLSDMLTFIQIHQDNNIPVTDKTPYASGEKAVQLLTAHGAKGLEFDSVYLLSVQGSVWASPGSRDKLIFPDNLRISSEADDRDDWLRIFYVALTRAKTKLHLSSHTTSDTGRQLTGLEFLAGIDNVRMPTTSQPLEPVDQILEAEWETYHRPPLVATEEALLLPLVEDYKLSVTHLNDFLDITRGGPQTVLEQHLLRFPQPQSLSLAYGSSVHKALQELFNRFRYDTVLPSLDFLLEAFGKALSDQRLNQDDHHQLWQRGQEELSLYYEAKSESFSPKDIIERSFANQQVMIGQACLNGKIDRIVELGRNQVSVHDVKTGKPSPNWKGYSPGEKIKLDKYKRQLLFYKLLVENSRDYRAFEVVQGVLESIVPLDGKFAPLELDMDGMAEELAKLQQLIQIVYQHIVTLDFPDTRSYPQDYNGYLQFQQDLLEGKI